MQAAYRRLAKALHPDHNGGDRGAETRLAEATAAYRSLRPGPGVDQGAPLPTPNELDPNADVAFGIEQLPAEAIESLFVAMSALGDILEIDEPYRLVANVRIRAPACAFSPSSQKPGGASSPSTHEGARNGGGSCRQPLPWRRRSSPSSKLSSPAPDPRTTNPPRMPTTPGTGVHSIRPSHRPPPPAQ